MKQVSKQCQVSIEKTSEGMYYLYFTNRKVYKACVIILQQEAEELSKALDLHIIDETPSFVSV